MKTKIRITKDFLDRKEKRAIDNGFACPKWIEFSRTLLDEGFVLLFYDSKTTVSKYIWVRKPDNKRKTFKVRFSNHKPSLGKEMAGNCFFVGISNLGITRTEDALKAVRRYFNG